MIVEATSQEELLEKVQQGLVVPAGITQYNVTPLTLMVETVNLADMNTAVAAKAYMAIAKDNMNNVAALIGADNLTEFLDDLSGRADSNLAD